MKIFHGTSLHNARKIMKHGLRRGWVSKNRYGMFDYESIVVFDIPVEKLRIMVDYEYLKETGDTDITHWVHKKYVKYVLVGNQLYDVKKKKVI